MVKRLAIHTVIMLTALFTAVAVGAAQRQLALVGGMLLDGTGAPPVHNAAILIDGNRIVAAGPANAVRIPAGTPVIDTLGATMLPGFVELHAHLLLVGHGDIATWFAWLEKHESKYSAEQVMALSARQLLGAGITSAADLGAPLHESVSVRSRIERGEIPGPRLSVSGPWITTKAAIFPLKYQLIVSSAAEAARAAEENIRGGVDVIKTHGGLSLEEYEAIVATAHQHHVKVHAHLYEEQEVHDAFTAGVDVLQHVGSAGTAPYRPELVKAIADSGRPIVPTAAHRVWVFPATREFPERLNDPELRREFPEDMWSELQGSFKDITSLDYFKDYKREEFYGDASILQWIKAGAIIGMGSDSGSPLNFHTDALWREAKVYVDHGVPAMQAIMALTAMGARILGKEQNLGTIQSGKLADITVVRGDPLFDIVSLANVVVVVKDGVAYKNGRRISPLPLPATP
jgi:imidazolonepropionase-like amidohydrolase